MNTTYPVDGMTCSGCEASVVRALDRSEIKATADAKAGTITVSGDHDAQEVAKVVSAAGFEMTSAADK